MSPAGKKFDEEALRKKIREQLEKEHSERQLIKQTETSPELLAAHEEHESLYLELYIRHQLQDEVYAKYPEFVKCSNHLNQLKWLTPLELEADYEFFPLTYSFWSRLRNRFSFNRKAKIPDTPEIQQMITEFRNEIEEEAKERIEKYREYVNQSQLKSYSKDEEKIFNEEQDKFYASLKGYHKYKNHIGETTWMTDEEFDAQEEFTDRVYTTKEKIRINGLILLTLLLVVVSVYMLVNYLSPDSKKGYLVVGLNKNKASLYINHSLAMGFTPGIPYPVEEGEHEVTIISSGFKTDPGFQVVDINVGDTTNINFNLIPMAGETGVVKLDCAYSDAGIYADGEFKGTVRQNRLLSLPLGDHTISVSKPNYISSPRLHTFSLNAGDTINLEFRLTHLESAEPPVTLRSSIDVGLIEVNSNVKGARIILNGNNTGFETDYVLQKIPYGQHIIRVEKDDYKVYPKERVVRLSKDERQARADFTLTSTTGLVTILVHPEEAKIYIDGKEASTGNFNGSLSLGEHQISFSEVEGYKKPDNQVINISNEQQNRFEFRYGTSLFLQVKPGLVIPSATASVSTGYIMSGINFKANSSNGPDIVLNKTINQNVWEMGFAFQYKNPPGSDAIFIRFQAPKDLNITDGVNLRLWMYSKDENYPLVISGKSEYKVIFNNVIILEKKTPTFKLSQISENNFEEIPLSRYIKSGINTLIISTDTDNSQFMEFWKAEIH